MKKIIFLTLFFLITPLNLGIGLFALAKSSQTEKEIMNNQSRILAYSENSSTSLYAALPQAVGEILGAITVSDARPVIIKKYLEKHSSPMPLKGLVEASDRYQVDPWLIVAIAQCESNLCKKSPPGSFNCWGFENGETRFLSWQQAYNQVAKTLRERYLDMGLTTPEEIMPKYAPPSVEKGGPWAKCVNQFMRELELGLVD